MNYTVNHLPSSAITLLLCILCLNLDCLAQIRITGTVTSQITGKALQGATVTDLSVARGVQTDSMGGFAIVVPLGSGTIEVSFLGYETAVLYYTTENHGPFRVMLREIGGIIEGVVVNTGYQRIPRERATGSFDYIGNDLVNRTVSPDILSRLENLSPGLLFNHGDAAGTDPFLIRGRSTITAEAQPLIVLDDFPYDGDLGNINPNDVESVSILKDAAAASIWGARAGNGVIVITTKKGSSSIPKVEVTSNLSVRGRPDLYQVRLISPADRIKAERFLYENGRYAAAANPTTLAARTTPIPEAVELMISSPADVEQRLAVMAGHDVRDEIARHFYRISANQQHSLNISGRQDRVSYYLSGGVDRNMSNLVGESHDRVSIRSGNSFKVNDRLSIDAAISFFRVNEERGNNNGLNTAPSFFYSLSPYSRLVDDDGHALPVYAALRKGYIDTAGNGRLLDWKYRPVDEILHERHTVKRRDHLVNVGADYTIVQGLQAQMKYQFQNQLEKSESLYREQSYYARNEINDFAQINPVSNAVFHPFPLGGILRVNSMETASHQGRAQLSFSKEYGQGHSIIALGGFEIRQRITATNSNINVGFNEQTGNMVSNVNTETMFQRRSSGTVSRINLPESTGELRDNFISYYSNAAYAHSRRYTISGSFRKDEANLFGLNTNQKGTPLWSVGAAWAASNEPFYGLPWLPYLKIRTSYGVNGNISRLANAQPTITLFNAGLSHQLPWAELGAPPNRNLSWEKVKQWNLGIDFGTKNNKVSGTVEYYSKGATNLLAQTPVDPTYGVSSMYMNVADMQGKGVDVQIGSVNIDKGLKWETTLLYSHSLTKVTNYLMPVATTGRTYLPISLANPLEGKPLYSVFALPWGGLDKDTGNPVGRVNGEPSMDYNAIYNGTPLENLVFMGTAQPTHFGAMMNTLSYKKFELSFNVSFKLGYYFRRPSIFYADLANGWLGHSDFARRWKNPGDETSTDVPSMIYPAVANRDNFYRYSETLVERGDHIRLEDLNVTYRIAPGTQKRIFNSIRVFAYLSNMGVLWALNRMDIDPYFNNVPRAGLSVAIGANMTF